MTDRALKTTSRNRRSDTPRNEQEDTETKEKKKKEGERNHQPEEGTKSPARPDEPLTESGERRRTARAFSL